MPNKRVIPSAMYDVQIEPTLADRTHFRSAVMTRYHSNYKVDLIPRSIRMAALRLLLQLFWGVFSCAVSRSLVVARSEGADLEPN